MVASPSPTQTLLAIDVGNTNLVLGVFEGDDLVGRARVATDRQKTPDEYAVQVTALLDLFGQSLRDVDAVIISSVVPSVQTALCSMVRQYLHQEPMVVSLSLNLGIEIEYSPPEAVGADRIINAIAATHLYGSPAVVVDFGTATTFDAIALSGAYIGGAIAPGLEIAQEALFAHTSQLPRVPLTAPPQAIGRTTIASLQSGILYGYASLVDGLVERFQEELGNGEVIATGGLASTIAPLTRTVRHVDPDLTLIGLRLLYARNRESTDSERAGQNQSVS